MNRNLITAALILVAGIASASPLHWLQRPLGWHAAAGGPLQVHQPSMEVEAPWVGIWTRTAVDGQYGQWLYARLLLNCEQWSSLPFGMIGPDGEFWLMEDLTGQPVQPTWPEPGSSSDRLLVAVCGLYGYQAPRRPAVGSVVR